jgi:hypothetical protein
MLEKKNLFGLKMAIAGKFLRNPGLIVKRNTTKHNVYS